VKLSRAVKTMLGAGCKITAVYALVEAADGTIYAGTGPQGIVLSLKGEKVSTIATLDDANIFFTADWRGWEAADRHGGREGTDSAGGKNRRETGGDFFGRRRAVCVEDGADAGWKYFMRPLGRKRSAL